MGEETSRGNVRRVASLGLGATLAGCLGAQALAFDYFEHRYLGSAAYEQALERADPALRETLKKMGRDRFGFGVAVPNPVGYGQFLRNDLPLQFGDLSALAADFTKDERELAQRIGEMQRPDPPKKADDLLVDTRRQWLSACRWFYRSRGRKDPPDSNWENCFERAGNGNFSAPPSHLWGSSGYIASREELASHEMVAEYISLASQNKEHFPRHSWKAYSEHHEKALRLARCYGGSGPCEGGRRAHDEPVLAEALISEAFAQHYLQDSFSAGHIGSQYGGCVFEKLGQLICTPTKRRLQQTHDALNEYGVEVKLPRPPEYFDGVGPPGLKKTLQDGWTAFGDDHLFIREADFQRAVIVRTAAMSITEVFGQARADAPGGAGCTRCTTDAFPITRDPRFLSGETRATLDKTDLADPDYPVGDLVQFDGERSRDERVPGIPVEGWKVGVALARQSLGGDWLTGPLETGALLRLDYYRNTDPAWPNTGGLEVWGYPNFRTSYLLTLGYSLPREVASFSLAVRAKYGWRIEDAFTRDNPTSQRIGGQEIVFPAVEVTAEIYPPVSFFIQVNLATWFFRQGTTVKEYINHNEYSSAFGFKFDLSRI